jgi:hypothetical protein
MVLGQPLQKVSKTPSQWEKLGMPVISVILGRRIMVLSGLGKKETPISKISRAKSAGGGAEVVEYLL